MKNHFIHEHYGYYEVWTKLEYFSLKHFNRYNMHYMMLTHSMKFINELIESAKQRERETENKPYRVEARDRLQIRTRIWNTIQLWRTISIIYSSMWRAKYIIIVCICFRNLQKNWTSYVYKYKHCSIYYSNHK